MNTPVSYPTAILLQEKGINIWSEYRYTDFNGVERLEKEASEIFPYAPTIADVVMRLYEKYGIWIYADSHEFGKWCYYYRYNRPHELSSKITENGQFGLDDFNSPTEAYEAAITHVLKNLI